MTRLINKTTLKTRLKNYMTAYDRLGYFNGSVLAAYKGEILIHEGYGSASRTFNIPNSPQTCFPIASLTKNFTAAAILLLEEQGLMKLEDTVALFIAGLTYAKQVTIHQLLSNTSGVSDFTSMQDYWTKEMRLPADLTGLIHRIKDKPLEFEPGSQYSYCNSNYILLTAIIEKVSGQSYAHFLQENLLKPFGLKNTGVLDGRTIVQNLASGYTVNKDFVHPDYIDMSFPLGAYGMYSTTEDLFRWTEALFSGKVLNKRSLNNMLTPCEGNYGYGWGFDKIGQTAAACHFGDVNGYCAEMLKSLDGEITVIVMSNFNLTPVTKINRDLAKIILHEEVRSPVFYEERIRETEISATAQGTYSSKTNDASLTLEQDGRTWLLTIPKRYGVPYTIPLLLVSKTDADYEFISSFTPEKVKVMMNEENKEIVVIHEDTDGIKTHYTKYKEAANR
ncbi:CubicO group peptidase, beta-lactamase class C family [Bacillus sp. OV194]|nr:CubicO group peptidase, beta-lactamase class C family [Bacillus sp. OV194]